MQVHRRCMVGTKSCHFQSKTELIILYHLYAASKKSAELLAECYSHLHKINCIGLRFFTVYGPWGRPDMATFIFTKKILEKESIDIFNFGKMQRDFTYIDDIVQGIIGAIKIVGKNKHKIYNLGNSKPEILLNFY